MFVCLINQSIEPVRVFDLEDIDALAFKCLSEGHFLRESLIWVPPFNLLQLPWGVLLKELVDRHVASTNADQNLTFLYVDLDSSRSELVHARALPQEHDFEFLPIIDAIEVLGHTLINRVILHWYIDGHLCLHSNRIVPKPFHVLLHISDLAQEVKRNLVCFKDARFKRLLVLACLEHLLLMGLSELIHIPYLLAKQLLLVIQIAYLVGLLDDQLGLRLVHVELFFTTRVSCS